MIGSAPDLAAGQGVTKFVQGHEHEQSEVLDHVPHEGAIVAPPHHDFIGRDHEPGPVQKHVDAG